MWKTLLMAFDYYYLMVIYCFTILILHYDMLSNRNSYLFLDGSSGTCWISWWISISWNSYWINVHKGPLLKWSYLCFRADLDGLCYSQLQGKKIGVLPSTEQDSLYLGNLCKGCGANFIPIGKWIIIWLISFVLYVTTELITGWLTIPLFCYTSGWTFEEFDKLIRQARSCLKLFSLTLWYLGFLHRYLAKINFSSGVKKSMFFCRLLVMLYLWIFRSLLTLRKALLAKENTTEALPLCSLHLMLWVTLQMSSYVCLEFFGIIVSSWFDIMFDFFCYL